jgi:hypothetical protein
MPGMRKVRTDYLLWLAASGIQFGAFAVIVMVSADVTPDRAGRYALDLAVLAVAASIIEWFAHALAVDCGFRLSRRPPADHAADYDAPEAGSRR